MPFVIESNFGVGAGLSGVCNRKMAEGEKPGSNLLRAPGKPVMLAGLVGATMGASPISTRCGAVRYSHNLRVKSHPRK